MELLPEEPLDSIGSPYPTVVSTVIILCGVVASYFSTGLKTAYEVANGVAIIMGCAIFLSLLPDIRYGLRNLVRVDIFCLFALYTLVLLEFIFPQEFFEEVASTDSTIVAVEMVLIGIAAFAIGRHCMIRERIKKVQKMPRMGTSAFVVLIWACIFLGCLHMWLAVRFDFVEWLDRLMGPRFGVPWARGRYGGWKDLLNELTLLFYIVPPVCGLVLARSERYSGLQKSAVVAGFLVVLFIALCGGTRNVIGSHGATFLAAYLIARRRITLGHSLWVSLLVTVTLFFAFYHMLEFRQMGLKNYMAIKLGAKGYIVEDVATRDTLFIDYNLYNISMLTSAVPAHQNYLGWELPYVGLTKPIPRAIWSSKPKELSMSVEEIVGVEGLTLSVTFIGEAYLCGGPLMVFVWGLFLGSLAAYWNRMAIYAKSDYGLVVYASGAFAGALSMRSAMFFTTAILPTVALLVFARLYRVMSLPEEEDEEGDDELDEEDFESEDSEDWDDDEFLLEDGNRIPFS